MAINLERIKERFSSYDEDELRRVVYIESDDYEKEVIEIARKELLSRNPINIWESKVTLKDVISCTDYEALKRILFKAYLDIDLKQKNFEKVFELLTKLDAKEQDGVYISMEFVDTNLSKEICSVFGEDITNGEKAEIRYCKWEEWLGFFIKNEQLQKLGKEKYVSQCLMEMTSAGFNEDEISLELEKIRAEIKEVDMSEC